MSKARIGTGITVVFATSAFTAEIVDVGGPGRSRESVNISHQGTTGAHVFIPATLVDNGEFTLDLHFDPDDEPPINGPNETITITWPKVSGDATAATWAFSGHVTGHEPTGTLEDKMTASVTIKVSGDITKVAATASGG